MTDFAKGDRVRVTKGTVDRATKPGDYLRLRVPGTIERLPPPEPLYVNAPEITEPETGDVVRDADEAWPVAWFCGSSGQWYDMHTLPDSVARRRRDELPKHLRLLVRGGQVWTS